jgi:predicted Zn-dependent peptidase
MNLSFGRFVIGTGTTAERVPEIISAIISETEKLKTKPVGVTELKKVREYMKSHLIMSMETSDGVVDFFADQEVLSDKIRTPEEFEELFSKVTPDDISRVSKIIFNNQKLTVAVIGNKLDKEAVSKAIRA